MDNIDFDFDLAEVSLDNNLPTIDDNYSDFSFDLKGGGSNNSEDKDLKTMKIENIVPEVELIDKPNLPSEEEEPTKIDVELVDEPMNSQQNNQMSQVEEVAKKPELTNSEVLQQLPIVRNEEDGVNPNLTLIDLDEDPGLLSNNSNENLEPRKKENIVLNFDKDETGGPVISEKLDETDSLDTDKYLANLREEVNEAKLNTEVDEFEEIRKLNKMLSVNYDEYIVKLRDFFKLMKGKKRGNYEFSILENGNLIMIDLETNDSEELAIPKYTNINNEIKKNKLDIGTLLYNISSVRKNIYLDQKKKFYSKNSEKFSALTRELSMLTKKNQTLSDYKDVVENKQLLEKNETLITEMKVDQAKNYLKLKEAKNDPSMTYQQRYRLMLDFIKNNKLLMLTYENNRNYLNLDNSNYTICESVEKSKVSKGKKSLKQTDDNSQSSDIVTIIPPPNTDSNFQETPNGESDSDIQEGEEQELNLQQLDKKTVDKPNELDELDELDEMPQESKSKKPDIFDAQELNLGDDIEEYAPKFGDNTGYPDTDLEDDDEQEEYKYNSSEKMTKQKKKEMEEQQQRDQEIPLNLDNEEPKVLDVEEKGKQDQTNEQPVEPNMTEKEASKMLRKLNKKADENIKVIELNTDLSLTSKCDDSKTKRSSIKTTNTVNGKKSKKKNVDSELKNCVFPFKTMEGQGKGKKKKSVMNKGCISDGSGDICATERNEDCTIKKFGYCKK